MTGVLTGEWLGRRSAWGLLFLVALGAFFINLGLSEVTDVNEAQRLLPALEMLEQGDWVVPHLDGAVYLKKPPLVYWIFAAGYRLNGRPSPLAARIPTALASLGTVLLAAWIGRRRQSTVAGFYTGLILATNVYLRRKAQQAEIDPFLMLALLAGIDSCWRALEAPPRRGLAWCLASGAAMGLAFLLKGPVLFPFLLAALLAAWSVARPAWPRLLGTAGGITLVVLLFAVPWCLLVIQRLGWPTVWKILHQESLDRLVRATRINSGPIYYYLVQISAAFLPWTWLLACWGNRRFTAFRRQRAGAFYDFVVWFVLFSFIIFSLIKGKETEYLLPLFPFLALMAGSVVDWLAQPEAAGEGAWRWTRWILLALCLAGSLTPLGLLLPAGRWLRTSWTIFVPLLAGALAAGGCLAALWRNRASRSGAFIMFGVAFMFLNVAIGDARKVRANENKSSRPLAGELIRHAAGGEHIYRWIEDRPQDVWYLRAATQWLPNPARLPEVVKSSGQPVGLVARGKDIKKLSRKYQSVLEFLPDLKLRTADLGFARVQLKKS